MKQLGLILLFVVMTSCSPLDKGFVISPVGGPESESNSELEVDTPKGEELPVDNKILMAPWELDGEVEQRNWTIHAYESLEVVGIEVMDSGPDDIEQYCPNYHQLSRPDKKNFWVHFLATISFYESRYDPTSKYTESFDDRFGERVVSRGLLQLSLESSLGYGCPLTEGVDLHDPLVNIDCGWRILGRWLARDGIVSGKESGRWRGGARYWAVLRTESIRSEIEQWNSSTELCRLNGTKSLFTL